METKFFMCIKHVVIYKQTILKQLTGRVTGWFPHVCNLKYSCE
jgi:hypothetical protein